MKCDVLKCSDLTCLTCWSLCLRRIIYHILTVEPVELIVSHACMYLILHMSLRMTESFGRPSSPFVSYMNLFHPKYAHPLSLQICKVKISVCIFKTQTKSILTCLLLILFQNKIEFIK